MTSKINMTRQIFICESSSILSTMMYTTVSYQHLFVDNQLKPNAVNTFSTNSSQDLLEDAKQNDTADSNRRNNIQALGENEEYHEAVLEMLETFRSPWVRHHGTINSDIHRIKMISPCIRPIFSVPTVQDQKRKNLKRRNLIKCWRKNWLSPLKRNAPHLPCSYANRIGHYLFAWTIGT